jgi:hypothetical protein
MSAKTRRTTEHERLADGSRAMGCRDRDAEGCATSGAHVGTEREDRATGEAWTDLPRDHARSNAYRWGEDGIAGSAMTPDVPTRWGTAAIRF